MRQINRLSLIWITGILMLACLPTLGPAPLPTIDPNAPMTAIVLTAGAAASQTAVNAPPTATSTALPTNTPTETPSPTATFLFLVPTFAIPPTQIPLGKSDRDFDCQVLTAEPQGFVAASARFIGRWVVANIGKTGWDVNSLDYRYIEGEKLHLQSVYDFPVTVLPGSTVQLEVDMQAPSTAGEYFTRWRIYAGKNGFCTMDLQFRVN